MRAASATLHCRGLHDAGCRPRARSLGWCGPKRVAQSGIVACNGAVQSLALRPQPVCDIAAVLSSGHLLVWDGGELAPAEAPGALPAFGLAHGAAQRLIGPRRGLAIGGGGIGEGLDVTRSMFSQAQAQALAQALALELGLGLATRGAGPASPVDIVHGTDGTGRPQAEARLRDEADLVADTRALEVLHQPGFDAGPLFAVRAATAGRTGQAGMRHRLCRMRAPWAGLVAGRGLG